MYKLVTVDLDGTLLDSYGNVSKENRDAIKKAVDKGVDVVLASGRPPRTVIELARELGTDKYIICGNGAMVYDCEKEEIVYNKFIPLEKVLQIAKTCERNSIYYNIYTEDTILTNSLNYNLLFYNRENAYKPESKQTRINIVENMYEYIQEIEGLNFLKITVCDKDKIIFDRIVKEIKKIDNVDVLDVEHMSRKFIEVGTKKVPIEYYYTEISSLDVHKWSAIEFLLKELHIDAKEVIGIGDNINDKTMIQNAGLGVVMGNSAPYIKEFGDIVTKDNNSSGVAEVLNRYINNVK